MPMLLTDAMADMTTRATTFSRKSRRSALPIVQATFLLGLCVATLASWVDRYTATPTVTYRRSLAAHSGESCTVRPAPQPCLSVRLLHSYCHWSIPGHSIAVVRALKSSLWAAAGGKGP